MIKILFVRTSVDLGIGGPIPPLGIMYISSYLKKNLKEIDTKLIDFYFYNLSDFIKIINDYSPDLVAFSSLSCEKNILFELSKEVKKINANIITVSGGPYPTVSFKEVLKSCAIDFVVCGEGEEAFLKLIKHIFYNQEKELLNIAYLKDKNMVFNKSELYADNLDDIPFPDWDIIEMDKYFEVYNWNGVNKYRRYMPIITSRGCPYGCKFCHSTLGKKFRKRSVENVLKEINVLVEKYGIKEFHIIDDVFNFDTERAKKLFYEINRKYSSSLAFSFPNGMRADLIDEEFISILKKSGCYKIYFGIESASDDLRNRIMSKNIKIESINTAIDLCLKYDIIPAGYFIFGYPGESPNDLKITLDYIKKTQLIIAHFFKFSDYSGMIKEKSYESFFEYSEDDTKYNIYKAYVEFYDIKRIFRIILYSPNKLKILFNISELLFNILTFRIILKLR
ncbi:MAG: B12-binding domain-containing radical SAM protein [Elusimicrobiales bacterium]